MFHWYGLLIGLGIVAAYGVILPQATHVGKEQKMLDDVLIWLFLPGLFGARAYHVITDFQLYRGRPLGEIFEVWNGGLGFYGAVIGVIVGLLLYCSSIPKTKRIQTFFTLLDLLAFGVPLAQAIGRIGNYVNKELYGSVTTLPWALHINGNTYHPLFLYELILNLCLFSFLSYLGWRRSLLLGKGQYAAIYVVCYGGIRFWLEFLRIESARPTGIFSMFTIAQWVSVGLMISGSILFWIRRHAPKIQFDFRWT